MRWHNLLLPGLEVEIVFNITIFLCVTFLYYLISANSFGVRRVSNIVEDSITSNDLQSTFV